MACAFGLRRERGQRKTLRSAPRPCNALAKPIDHDPPKFRSIVAPPSAGEAVRDAGYDAGHSATMRGRNPILRRPVGAAMRRLPAPLSRGAIVTGNGDSDRDYSCSHQAMICSGRLSRPTARRERDFFGDACMLQFISLAVLTVFFFAPRRRRARIRIAGPPPKASSARSRAPWPTTPPTVRQQKRTMPLDLPAPEGDADHRLQPSTPDAAGLANETLMEGPRSERRDLNP